MLTDDVSAASLRCDIALSGDDIHVHTIASEDSGGLALTLGCLSDDSSLACTRPEVEFIAPSCATYVFQQVYVPLEDDPQIICEAADTPCDSALCCIWSSTSKQADESAVYAEETVTYTITFTNHSPCTLEAVRIFDVVPDVVTVVAGSIHPAPKQGETLQTGISMGSIVPGQSVTLVYSVTVHSGASDAFVNCAHVKYCYMDCKGCCRHGVGSCRCSTVQILPIGRSITLSKSANKSAVCMVGDEITFTCVVANPGNVACTDVILTDSIPQGLCYKRGSTCQNNGAPENENPQNGIAIGALSPGQRCTVTFGLYVCIEPYQGNTPTEFLNTATATGYARGTMITADSNPVVIAMSRKCLCQCVQQCFCICDFCCLRYCYVYHNGVTIHDTAFGRMVVASFGIAVKYVNCNGDCKGCYYESKVVFHALPEEFDSTRFTVRFSDLACCINCCGDVSTCFEARLCYCKA